jgi:hypothetical protein
MRSRWLLLVFLLLPAPLHAERSGDDPFAAIKKKYGIYVVVRDKPLRQRWVAGRITADPADKKDVRTYAPILVEEFCIYPAGFVRRTKLRQIVLVRNLRLGKQQRTSVPDFARNILYIDASRGRKTEHYVRRVIHHEYFHVVDYLDDGKLYDDPGWSALNPADFRYGNGGQYMRDPNASVPSENHPGFLNRYSTSGIEEDKAEVYSYMITEYRHVAARAKKDKIIRAKMKYMQALLEKYSDDMDAGFWRKRRKN